MYDKLNRLTDITNSWAGHFGFSYDALSRRTALTRSNGVNTTYGYNNLSQLLSVLHGAETNPAEGAKYGYDAAGNRRSKQNLGNGIGDAVRTYTVKDLGSTCGTFLNGKRVDAETELSSGAVISLGPSHVNTYMFVQLSD